MPVLLDGPFPSPASPPDGPAGPAPLTMVNTTSHFWAEAAASVAYPSATAIPWYNWQLSHTLTASSDSRLTSAAAPTGGLWAGTGDGGANPTQVSDPFGFAQRWRGFPLATSASGDGEGEGGPSLSPALEIAGNGNDGTSPGSVWEPYGSTAAQGNSGQASLIRPALLIGSVVLASGPYSATTTQAASAGGPIWPSMPGSGVADLSGATVAQGFSSGQGSPFWMTLTAAQQATAQIVPDQPHVSLFSSLSSANPSRVIEIPGDLRTRVLRIELSPASAADTPLEMAVYDTSGRSIADSALDPGPDTRVLSMNIPIDSSGQSSGVYVKIAAPLGLGGSLSSFSGTGSDSFDLQITREPEAVSPLWQTLTPQVHLGDGAISLAPTVGQIEPSTALARLDDASAGPNEAEVVLGASAIVSAAPSGAGQQQLPSIAVATGPLPERAGAPLGGVLAEGDPVPQLDRHDPALVDLALIGLPEPDLLPGLGEAGLEAIVTELERAPSGANGLVAIRGPGGFPLRAKGLPGEGVPDSKALFAVLPPAGATTVMVGSAAAAALTKVPTELVATARPRRRLSATALSGLTVAMAMVFSLVLPDMSRLMTIIEGPRSRPRLRFPRRRDSA